MLVIKYCDQVNLRKSLFGVYCFRAQRLYRRLAAAGRGGDRTATQNLHPDLQTAWREGILGFRKANTQGHTSSIKAQSLNLPQTAANLEPDIHMHETYRDIFLTIIFYPWPLVAIT